MKLRLSTRHRHICISDAAYISLELFRNLSRNSTQNFEISLPLLDSDVTRMRKIKRGFDGKVTRRSENLVE